MKLFKHHISDTVLSRIIAALCSMGIVIITSRAFGADGRGYIGILGYAMTFLMIISDFVGGSSLITLIPKINLKSLLLPSYLWSFLVCSIGYLFLPFFDDVPEELYPHIFALTFMLAIITVNYSVFIGKQLLQWRNWLAVLIVLGNLALITTMVKVYGSEDVFVYVQGLYLGEGIAFLLSLVVIFSKFGKEFSKPFKWHKDIFKLGFWSQLGHLTQFFNYRLSYIAILWVLSRPDLGLYATVFVLAESIWIFGNSIGTVQHMKIVNSADKDFHVDLTLRYMKLSGLITVIAVAVGVVIPQEFWTWLLGSEFSEFRYTFIWLAPGVVFLGFSTVLSHYYHAKQRFVSLFLANFTGLVVKIAALLVFWIGLELWHVALATSFGLLAILVHLTLLFKRETGIGFRSFLPDRSFIVDGKQMLSSLLSSGKEK
jgi:O-antigen/teichoic acid export membrane protein